MQPSEVLGLKCALSAPSLQNAAAGIPSPVLSVLVALNILIKSPCCHFSGVSGKCLGLQPVIFS